MDNLNEKIVPMGNIHENVEKKEFVGSAWFDLDVFSESNQTVKIFQLKKLKM